MWRCASSASAGVAFLPVPIAQTGSYAMSRRADLIGGQAVEAGANLAIEHGERLAPLALSERLADADDRREPGRDRRARLAVDPLVGVAEQPAPLGVPDDDVGRARVARSSPR